MKSEVSAATKQLRWQLLDMFPQAPMKLVSEAAKCGDLDTAVAIIAERLGAPAADNANSTADPPTPPTSSVAAAGPKPDESIASAAEPKAAQELEDASLAKPTPSPEAKEALAWLARAIHTDDVVGVDVSSVLKEDKASTTLEDVNKCSDSVRRTVDGWEIKCSVDATRPCQSMRTNCSATCANTVLQHVGTDNTAAFAAVCFEQMLQREQELEGEFCVFYHSYNSAALIYEVEAEIARYAFGKDEMFAPLPRIIQKNFTGITIDDLRNSEGAKHADCLPAFRALAICASPTLFAFGSEAPPLNCFRHGYGIPAPLGPLTLDILCEATGRSKASLAPCLKQLIALAAKFGLVTHGYGSDSGNTNDKALNRLGGQMLQIFIHRSEVDHYVYNSLPYGVPIPTNSVERWLAGKDVEHAVDGQVRMLMCPDVFLDETRGRIFHYCGDWEFLGGNSDVEGSRAAFVQDIGKILRPVLSEVSPAEMRNRLTGETDAERTTRFSKEATKRERTDRAAAEKGRAAAKKGSGSGGYTEGNASTAETSHKTKGTKH